MSRTSRTKPPVAKKPGSRLRLIVSDAKPGNALTPIPEAQKSSKAVALHALLARNTGVTLMELSSASGWQAHCVRAWLSGVRKRLPGQLQRDIRENGASSYRLTAPNLSA